jgi:hypothetical protein
MDRVNRFKSECAALSTNAFMERCVLVTVNINYNFLMKPKLLLRVTDYYASFLHDPETKLSEIQFMVK